MTTAGAAGFLRREVGTNRKRFRREAIAATVRRDHAIIVVFAQIGLRVSEVTGLRCGDIHLGAGAHVTTIGKGRKQRITPLTKETAAVLPAWLAERGSAPAEPLFPTSTGTPLNRKGLARRIAKHAALAAKGCPSLSAKTVTPHVLRHTAAMRLLRYPCSSIGCRSPCSAHSLGMLSNSISSP